MKLIIGLGNPGKKYTATRHNAGFIVLDEIRNAWDFGEFLPEAKFEAEISTGLHRGEKVLLAKPQTFMNLSGKSAQALVDFYKVSLEDILVIHDDLDIELGAFKISTDSSAGGHGGVASLIENFGTQKFKRIRIGIEGAERKKERIIPGSDFVLQDFSAAELTAVRKVAAQIIPIL